MSKVFASISVSLDGFVAGPNATLEQPLGEQGERLHEWAYGLAAWRNPHGLEGGEVNRDGEVIAERDARTGSVVMGRRMFSGGSGAWEDDPRANGWWGDDPPFHGPVFVVTSHAREPLTLGDTTFTFVTGGVEEAVGLARGVAASVGKDVAVAGGGTLVRQVLRLGLLEQLELHIAPVVLGDGQRLFDPSLDLADDEGIELTPTRVVPGPEVTHIRYAVGARTRLVLDDDRFTGQGTRA